MGKRDLYEVLSVDKHADAVTLKKAYKRLAMKYHPDRNADDPQAEVRFKEAKDAYDILSDEKKRTVYDRFGHAGVEQSHGGGGGNGNAEGFRDIFDQVFGDIFSGGGAGGGRERGVNGSDLAIELSLSLEEAILGTTTTLHIPSQVGCSKCGGSGAKSGTKPSTCSGCNGVGQVRIQQGFFSLHQTCHRCRGKGTIIASPCSTCSGSGTVSKNKTLSVKVPPGVGTGDRIRLGGEGSTGRRGGHPGDLYVDINVKKHPVFTREEANLHCKVPIGFATATLGGEIEVPTLKGKHSLKIPAGTQNGKRFVIHGKGIIPVRTRDVGNLICHVEIETPINLSKKQKELLRQFQDAMHDSKETHDPERNSWSHRVQSFFAGLKS